MVDNNKEEKLGGKLNKRLFKAVTNKILYINTGETKRVSLKVTVIYLIVGALWILSSDKVLGILAYDKEMITFFSLIKGWVYVAITGVLIYILIYSSLKRIETAENELLNSYKNLSTANKKLELAYEQLTKSQVEIEQQYEKTLKKQVQLQDSEERYRLLSEATNDAIWEEVDDIRCFSDRWYEITGYSKKDIQEMGSWEDLIHPEDKMAAREVMLVHKKNKTPYYKCQYRLQTKSGEYIWIQARGKALFNDKGDVYRMGGSHTDITELKKYEQRLYYLAYHDLLTGLQNRLALNERLNTLINENKDQKCALLFVDVDNFKYVNDTMGHSFGDMLLVKLSERLIELKSSNSTVYRIGGDEFVFLVEHIKKNEEIEKMAVNILKSFKSYFQVEGSNLYTTVSIGVSIFPEHGVDIDSLLKKADIAVYKAKETGRNRIVFYNDPMNEVITERMHIEKYLRKALDNNEFELYYQPQLNVRTGKISGFEALIRWRNSELGFVSPQKFIGIAEDTHLIVPIGEWVLRTACIFLKRIHQMGYTDLNISINISMLQLLQDNFVEMVIETLESVQISSKHIELEITESILMESYEVIAGKLKILRLKGVKVALDDFGKGYSSLNYLKQLPITTLKIDKTFIDTISSIAKNNSFTDLIVKMGRNMDLCVVAEGVETQEQMDYLVKHKCHKIQGFFFSKPVTENEAVKKIKDQFFN